MGDSKIKNNDSALIEEGITRLHRLPRGDAKEEALLVAARLASIREENGTVYCAVNFEEKGDSYVGIGTQCQVVYNARDRLIPMLEAHWNWKEKMDSTLGDIAASERAPTEFAMPQCSYLGAVFFTEGACAKAEEIMLSDVGIPFVFQETLDVTEIRTRLREEAPKNLIRVPNDQLEYLDKLWLAYRICGKFTNLEEQAFETATDYLLDKRGVKGSERMDFMVRANAIAPVLNDIMEVGALMTADFEKDESHASVWIKRATENANAERGAPALPALLRKRKIFQNYREIRKTTKKEN